MESKKEALKRHAILKGLQDQITGINSMLLWIGCPLQIHSHPLLEGDDYKDWMRDFREIEETSESE